MRAPSAIGTVLVGLALVVPQARAFQVTLDSGAGTLTIVDNDVNDLDPSTNEIDFSQTVGAVFFADGRVTQAFPAINRQITIGTRTAGSDGVFQNLDGAAHTFIVTVDTDTFTPPGAPLGWSVAASGLADDTTTPTQSGVEIVVNDVALGADSGGTLLGTLQLPITPAVSPLEQPASFDDAVNASASGDASQLRLTWTFRPGPRDQIRLPDPAADLDGKIVASVFNGEDRCAVRMGRRAARLAKLAGADDARCVKDAVAAGGGSATACVDDQTTSKTTSGEERLLADYAAFCTSPPAFATNVGTCCEGGANDGAACVGAAGCPGGSCTAGACISGAAEDAATAVAHELFGATVSVDDGDAGACQVKVLHAAVGVHEIRWRSLAKCMQRHLPTLATEAEFVATCLGPPQPAFAGIASKESALRSKLERRCVKQGVTPLASVFPGACAGESDAGYPSCLSRRIACRFCLGAVVAADIGVPLDCDALDDGATNGSCP
jgi:hypothetical protein